MKSKSKADFAVDTFNKGFNCSQAVFTSHCEELGLSLDIGRKTACGFGGGTGHTSGLCGAVAGAVMLIGLKYGKYEESDNAAKEKTYKLVKEYTEKFVKEFGSVNCTSLLKHDLSKEDELKKAREAGLFKTMCPQFVKRSVELVEEILKS